MKRNANLVNQITIRVTTQERGAGKFYVSLEGLMAGGSLTKGPIPDEKIAERVAAELMLSVADALRRLTRDLVTGRVPPT